MPSYNKLVRDLIPEIIRQEGKNPLTKVLSNEEYLKEVERKMHEELAEYLEAKNTADKLEELADLLELLHTAAIIHGISPEKLEKLRRKKSEERGGFAERIYLVEVLDN